MKYIVIYDKLVNVKNMILICPSAKFVSLLLLSNHKIEFLKPNYKKYETSVNLVELYGSETPVVIFSINDEEEAKLDSYYSYKAENQNFYKISIKINIKNVIQSCTAYIVTHLSQKWKPSSTYLLDLKRAYEVAGIDTKVIDLALNSSK